MFTHSKKTLLLLSDQIKVCVFCYITHARASITLSIFIMDVGYGLK